METSGLPLKLYQFNSGVMVLQLSSLDSDSIAEGTAILVSLNQGLFSIMLIGVIRLKITAHCLQRSCPKS